MQHATCIVITHKHPLQYLYVCVHVYIGLIGLQHTIGLYSLLYRWNGLARSIIEHQTIHTKHHHDIDWLSSCSRSLQCGEAHGVSNNSLCCVQFRLCFAW